jgi:hypothetical protein
MAVLHPIEANILGVCEVVSLSDADYAGVISHLASLGVTGGPTYDALILHAATKVEVDRITTLNEGDFRRVYPAVADKVVAPEQRCSGRRPTFNRTLRPLLASGAIPTSSTPVRGIPETNVA